MDERSAREATWLEAYETARPPAASWSDEDRAWADRVALEAAAPAARDDEFIADRAGHAMQRLGAREPLVRRPLATASQRSGAAALLLATAFAVGLCADAIGGGQRINLLAPPLWGVLAWNAVVYALLLALPLWRLARRRHSDARRGPIVRAAAALLRTLRLPRAPVGGSAAVVGRFTALWAARSQVLATLRVEAILHAAAAALALGLVAGLYARGLVLDYRAAWESTFLDPAAAHALVAAVLGPAARLSGRVLPDVASFAALRSTHGSAVAGAPAADWIHLIALTLVLFVAVPRLALGAGCALLARRRAGRFALPLDEPYFQRLLRLRRGDRARVTVFPYGSAPTPQATLGLRALLAEAFGPHADLQVAPPVAFGDEDDAPLAAAPGTTHAIALFDLAATPEAENQGRFAQRLVGALAGGTAFAVLLDASAFQRRFGKMAGRLEQREAAWRRWSEPLASAPVAVDLDGPASAAAAASLNAAFAPAAWRDPAPAATSAKGAA